MSKLRIVIVCRAMSSTSPSTPSDSTVIQSPTRTMSLVASWMEATSDRIVSRKTRIRIAVAAPSPLSSSTGDCHMRIETTRTTVTSASSSLTSCR